MASGPGGGGVSVAGTKAKSVDSGSDLHLGVLRRWQLDASLLVKFSQKWICKFDSWKDGKKNTLTLPK